MTLDNGQHLGHYEIVGPLGAGGMGEVYRARDTKLGREVAIKVLPAELAGDEDRMARFEREAKLLAALNHAAIATLYGLEESDGHPYLVMEIVEGETLAERLAAGPLPLGEAINLFVQIAEGLEAAHEKGIVHRDLKPANIKITPDGKIKILDFGLAKAFAPDGDGSVETSQSPTLTKGTALGVIMGTASYMSPEQARGKLVDTRTDVWAFGCCLYEALTGTKAFDGDTVSDIISAVLRTEPDLNALPADVPANVRRMLERCARKERRERLQHVGDARLELNEPAEARVEPAVGSGSALTLLAAVVLGASLAGAAAWFFAATPDAPATTRFAVTPPPGFRLSTDSSDMVLALSPDGRTLVFVAAHEDRDGANQLYRRRLDELEPEPIEGTEGGMSPFFSPDGEWVGFVSGQKIQKIRLDGTGAAVICDAPGNWTGGAWLRDGTIVLSREGDGLSRVSASGGVPEPLTTLGPDDLTHDYPQLLPDGEAVVFTIDRGSVDVVGVHIFDNAQTRDLFEGSSPRYAPSGRLVYFVQSRDSLMAVPFDPAALTVTGEPIAVAQGLRRTTSGADFAIGQNGTLAYVAASEFLSRPSRLVWVDRAGGRRPVELEPRLHLSLALSPDDTRAALALPADGGLWIYDFERGTSIRFSDRGRSPVWSRDGSRIAYARWDGTSYDLLVRPADAAADATVLVDDVALYNDAASWTADGSRILFAQAGPKLEYDVFSIDVEGDEGIQPVLQTPFSEAEPVLSPDEAYLAYQSNESGRFEIYVRPFPDTDSARWVISAGGGTEPRWAADGKTLFFREDERVLAVPVATGGGFEPGRPEVVLESRLPRVESSGSVRRRYDVARNGVDFLVSEIEDNAGRGEQPEIVVIENWFEELERLALAEP